MWIKAGSKMALLKKNEKNIYSETLVSKIVLHLQNNI
jgi:hypothetical protein